jgi:hypothetical protein
MKTNCNDTAEISGQILCDELELNPELLKLFSVKTMKNGTLVSWDEFVAILAIFLFRKSVRT